MSVIDMAACESTLEMWGSYPHRTPHRTARTPGIGFKHQRTRFKAARKRFMRTISPFFLGL
jgi:hypothetical protein